MSQPLSLLTVEAVKAIYADMLASDGGADGVADEALLESAVAAPLATMGGKPVFTDPIEIAAAYFFSLCRNHLFMDGNKRTALAACLTFLCDNHLPKNERLDMTTWEPLTLDMAASRLDREQTNARLRMLL